MYTSRLMLRSLNRTISAFPPTASATITFSVSTTMLPLRRLPTKPILNVHLPRAFHTTPANRAGSPLFALGSLSNSRESQWFKKASGLSAVEHSPNLQLIRDSEVVPFASGGPPVAGRVGEGRRGGKGRNGKRAKSVLGPGGGVGTNTGRDGVGVDGLSGAQMRATPMPAAATIPRSSSLPPISTPLSTAFPYCTTRDAKALSIGREVLRSNAEHVARLKQSLRQEQRIRANEVGALRKENKRLLRENRSASVGIVVAVAIATAVVAWKTWPEARKPRVGFGAMRKEDRVVDDAVPVVEDTSVEDTPILASVGQADIAVPLLPLGEIESTPAVGERQEEPFMEKSAVAVEAKDKKTRGWASWFWNHS